MVPTTRTFVFVHGSFRGGWYWGPVGTSLRTLGHRVWTPSLAGMGEHRHHAALLAAAGPLPRQTWVDDIVHLCTYEDLHDVVLVGHSLGGVSAAEAADRLGPDRIRVLAYLDAPVLAPGQAPADLYPPRSADSPPVDEAVWSPPFPVNSEEITDPAVQRWMAERLCPNPIGPGAGPLTIGDIDRWRSVRTRVAFCSKTPAMYPSALSRAGMEARGAAYDLLDAGHDAPVSATDLVVEWLTSL